ncbi:MarR family transcriptional regulator [Nocardia sp. NPDC127579]|uniref:MarR family transcriptional regulator n=1 Tax=Nocardia sp. NPDC127579 TaxID=3345402 RepID=UPI00363CC3AB
MDDVNNRRWSSEAAQTALRELNTQLALLNRQLGSALTIKDTDWNCLDLINRNGPLSPGALAKLAGLHPATMTGVLDRLQRGGWIIRERDPEAADRRAVAVRAVGDRTPELTRVLSGMRTRMDALFEQYTDDELALITEFMRRAASAGHDAAAELAQG